MGWLYAYLYSIDSYTSLGFTRVIEFPCDNKIEVFSQTHLPAALV